MHHCHRFVKFVKNYQIIIGMLLSSIVIGIALNTPTHCKQWITPVHNSVLVPKSKVHDFKNDMELSWSYSYHATAKELRAGKWDGYITNLKKHLDEETHALWVAYFGDLLYSLKLDEKPSQEQMNKMAQFYDDLGNGIAPLNK